MEIFDVFKLNGIENYPAAGENFLESVILKVSQTHFSKDFYPKGGGGQCPPWLGQEGAYIFQGGGQCPPRGGCEVPCLKYLSMLDYNERVMEKSENVFSPCWSLGSLQNDAWPCGPSVEP